MRKITRSKGFSTILILVLILFVPGFLYLLMERLGKHEYVKLPIYGEKQLTGEMRRVMGREIPDTLYHQLDAVEFTGWDGRQVTFLGTDSIITVAHLFYTSDSVFSTAILDYMDGVATKFMNKELVELFSISVDPADSPTSLAAVEQRYGDLEAREWRVVANPSVDILNYAREQMLLDAMIDPTDSTHFVISDQIILIDAKRRIRGFYSVSQPSEVKRLEDEIKVQLVEEIRDNPLKVERK